MPAGLSSAGLNATGIAAVTKAPPIEFGPGRNMLWKATLPPGHSSPVIWGDRLFLTAFDSEQQRLLLLALDRKTGRTLWRQEQGYEKLGDVHVVSTPATATPVVDGERVYTLLRSGRVVRVQTSTVNRHGP